MSKSFIASVQYDDLTGTAAADGFEAGGPLGDLVDRVPIKRGFIPIGFGLHQLDPLENGRLPIVVFAVDAKKVGESIDEMRAYIKKHGQLPVTGFRNEIAPNEFQSIFKRFRLRLHTKALEAEQLTIEAWHYPEDDHDEVE